MCICCQCVFTWHLPQLHDWLSFCASLVSCQCSGQCKQAVALKCIIIQFRYVTEAFSLYSSYIARCLPPTSSSCTDSEENGTRTLWTIHNLIWKLGSNWRGCTGARDYLEGGVWGETHITHCMNTIQVYTVHVNWSRLKSSPYPAFLLALSPVTSANANYL